MTAISIAVWQVLRHQSVDWIAILGLSVLICVLVFLAIWINSKSQREFDKQLDNTREEIRKDVSALIEAKIQPAAALPIEQPAPSQPENEVLSLLQKDATTLSMRLLEFLEAQGPPPQPKYTAEEIQRMSLAKSRQLIEAHDKDYDFACEYHFGGNAVEGVKSADELHKLMMARFMLLHPWYEKVRASYELEFRIEVERMNNRFAVEGLGDNILKVPVEGKMGRENIKAIASKLWELAYKVREKKVKIENS